MDQRFPHISEKYTPYPRDSRNKVSFLRNSIRWISKHENSVISRAINNFLSFTQLIGDLMDTDDISSLSPHLLQPGETSEASSHVFNSPARGTWNSEGFSDELAKIHQTNKDKNEASPEELSEVGIH